MRLLKCNPDGEFSFAEFFDGSIKPEYAILSHTWGPDEVTFKDFTGGKSKDKAGYSKIRFCGQQAASDSLQYFWVDTCCIDKSSSTELQEAINSMFLWYRNAAECYVYLSDVSLPLVDTFFSFAEAWELSFRNSRWFTRGWTLQELIAPASVGFYSKEGTLLGDKGSLEDIIYAITDIPVEALRGRPLPTFSVPERMAWAESRETKRAEDTIYSLLGIFDVHMPLLYSEGRDKALRRLYEEIEKLSKAPTILQIAKQHLALPLRPHCKLCKPPPGTQEALDQHLSSPARGFACHKCTRLFTSQEALDQHLRSPAHGLGSLAHGFACHKCTRILTSQEALDQHLRSPAHGLGSLAHGFACHKCKRVLASQEALDQHLSSSVHDIACHKCKQGFTSQKALDKHLSSPIHALFCNPCNRSFESKDALNQHLSSPAHNTSNGFF